MLELWPSWIMSLFMVGAMQEMTTVFGIHQVGMIRPVYFSMLHPARVLRLILILTTALFIIRRISVLIRIVQAVQEINAMLIQSFLERLNRDVRWAVGTVLPQIITKA